MHIVVQQGKVELTVIADSPEVQQVLQVNAEHLRGALEQQGLFMDTYTVLLRQHPDGNGSGWAGEGNARWAWDGEDGSRAGGYSLENAASVFHSGYEPVSGIISVFA